MLTYHEDLQVIYVVFDLPWAGLVRQDTCSAKSLEWTVRTVQTRRVETELKYLSLDLRSLGRSGDLV